MAIAHHAVKQRRKQLREETLSKQSQPCRFWHTLHIYAVVFKVLVLKIYDFLGEGQCYLSIIPSVEWVCGIYRPETMLCTHGRIYILLHGVCKCLDTKKLRVCWYFFSLHWKTKQFKCCKSLFGLTPNLAYSNPSIQPLAGLWVRCHHFLFVNATQMPGS